MKTTNMLIIGGAILGSAYLVSKMDINFSLFGGSGGGSGGGSDGGSDADWWHILEHSLFPWTMIFGW